MVSKKFYLKNATVIEQLAKVDALVFDKTGTLTTRANSEVKYTGSVLSFNEEKALKATLRASNHPLSRTIYETMTNIPLEKKRVKFLNIQEKDYKQP